MSAYVAKHLQNRQKSWNMATQKRIALTTTFLDMIKNVKTLGMSGILESRVQGLRQDEIDMSKRLRWIMVAYNASGM